ncbi:NAD(P)-dependent oxidoreductase [Sphingomonas sp. MMS24-J13]|uniref:NAD(P)-dependent oxidoreductase n=1 Tax=Sphingomonas sp. MMS24-J13 TaxID=3238686 RepID=UPI0038502B63
MKIALIGASGNVGQRVTAEATSRGHEVIAIARNTASIEAKPGVTPVAADLTDEAQILDAVKGADVVVLSVRFQDLDFEKVLATLKKVGKRVLIVGGAASLEVAPGKQLIDTEGFPDFIKVEAEPARQALKRLQSDSELDWTFLSPSVFFGPGERTGAFRLGKDELLTAADGKSHISYEDYSIALLDEIESPKHKGERFTVGY